MTCACGHARSEHRYEWDRFRGTYDRTCSHIDRTKPTQDRCHCHQYEERTPMSDLHDAAMRAGVFQYIQKRAGELLAAAKQDLQALPNGDTVAGRHNDQVVCKASWVRGRKTITVTDERALLAWVKEHHPEEIVESVNPAFLKTFSEVDGQVHWQGEPVDFMAVKQGDPYISVKSNDETPFLVAQLLRGGQVSLDGVRQLEA